MNQSIILKGENVKIIKEEAVYKIEFKFSAYSLINSLIKTRIIHGGSTDELYKTITFKAESVITLKQYQENNYIMRGRKNVLIRDIAKMLGSLVLQLNYLIEKESQTIIGYNPEEIIVINGEKFAFLGSELVANIDVNTEMAMISCPFSPRDFLASPELLNLKELPSFIHYKTAYFSLALLIIYALLGDNEFYTDYLKENYSKKYVYRVEELMKVLDNHAIKNTKIFWLLSRCLIENAKDRSIILI